MITDPLFYRLFEISPETFFLVLGMPSDQAHDMAARYQYDAMEFKETSHRVDGIFRPKEPGLPLYVLEVQFYRLPNVFAGLLAKTYTYLKQNDPGQPFVGVVLFASRNLEPSHLAPYQPLLDAGLVRRFYLDDMPEIPEAPLGLSILYLIRESEVQAPTAARELVGRTKQEIGDEALRHDLVELIETVIMYKLPRLGREEIQAMLQVHDIRESKVFQEAKEEGLKEGLEKGIEKGVETERQRSLHEKLRAAAKLAALDLSAEAIADSLGLDLEVVRAELAKTRP
jgi:predicted transposase/invertase (TIGR01784 family)